MKGIPSDETSSNILPEKVSLSPQQFRGIKQKRVVREGDKVKTGSPLFFDKLKPEVKWASPSSGVVTSIHFGDRRIIEKIEISVEDKKPESFEAQYKRRLVKTTKPEHKEKGMNWRIKGKDRPEISIKLYKEKPGQAEFNKQLRRVAGHEFGG